MKCESMHCLWSVLPLPVVERTFTFINQTVFVDTLLILNLKLRTVTCVFRQNNKTRTYTILKPVYTSYTKTHHSTSYKIWLIFDSLNRRHTFKTVMECTWTIHYSMNSNSLNMELYYYSDRKIIFHNYEHSTILNANVSGTCVCQRSKSMKMIWNYLRH